MRVLGMRELGEGEREVMLDDKNRKLLKILSSNSKTPLKELARTIGLSLQATYKRLKSLEERGVIRYTISVNPKLVGRGTLAFIFVDSTAGKEKELSQ
ncbi:MAG: winged helix-turn-helix transcriptional regulator, partial [Candidatus Hadarchaeales archaeon]